MEPLGRAPTKQRRRERILVEPQQPPAARASKPRGVASTKTPENCQPAARSSKTVPTARTRHQGCRHRPSGSTGARVFTRRSSEKEQDGASREDCGAKGIAAVSPRASKAFAKNSFTPRCESNGTGGFRTIYLTSTGDWGGLLGPPHGAVWPPRTQARLCKLPHGRRLPSRTTSIATRRPMRGPSPRRSTPWGPGSGREAWGRRPEVGAAAAGLGCTLAAALPQRGSPDACGRRSGEATARSGAGGARSGQRGLGSARRPPELREKWRGGEGWRCGEKGGCGDCGRSSLERRRRRPPESGGGRRGGRRGRRGGERWSPREGDDAEGRGFVQF